MQRSVTISSRLFLRLQEKVSIHTVVSFHRYIFLPERYYRDQKYVVRVETGLEILTDRVSLGSFQAVSDEIRGVRVI